MLHADSRKLGQAAPLKDQERALQVLQKNWQDLIKPTKLNVSSGRDPARFALVVAEPLERGFGEPEELLVEQPLNRGTTMAIGFCIAVICLWLGLWLGRPLLRRDDEAGAPDRIRALYGSQLIPVRDLRLPAGPIADVASIAALADLAKRYESLIMHVADEQGEPSPAGFDELGRSRRDQDHQDDGG